MNPSNKTAMGWLKRKGAKLVETWDIGKWVPVIGALCGAIIGFGAAFLTAWFNQSRAESIAKNNRRRDRLEELYRTLIKVRIDSQELSGKLIQHIHHGKAIVVEDVPDLPPIIKLQMLIDLYFTELHSDHVEYLSAKDAFGKKFGSLVGKKFGDVSLEAKQKVCGEVLVLLAVVENRISALQKHLAVLSRDLT